MYELFPAITMRANFHKSIISWGEFFYLILEEDIVGYVNYILRRDDVANPSNGVIFGHQRQNHHRLKKNCESFPT